MSATPKPQKPTYRNIILNHMLAGQSISNMEAYDLYKMTCFLRRISELRAAGVIIQDEFVEQNGKRFKRYWIDKPTNSTANEVTK